MYVISYIHFFSALVYLYLAQSILRRDTKAALNRIGAVSFAAFFIWSLAFTFVHHPAVSREDATLWLNISAIGGLLHPVLTYRLAEIVSHRSNRILLYGGGVSYVILLLMQFLGTEVISILGTRPYFYGWQVHFRRSAGYAIYVVFSTVIVIAQLWILLKALRDRSLSFYNRKQAMIIFLGGITVYVVSMVIVWLQSRLNLGDNVFIDISFLGWAIAIYIGIQRYRLFAPSLANSPQEILSTIDDALILTDCNDRITYTNPAAVKLLDSCFENVTTFSHALLQWPEQGQTAQETFTEKSYQAQLTTSSGKTLPVLVSSSTINKNDQTIQGNIYVIRDISEFMRINQELERSQRFEALSIFAGGIAHDLNNILGGILGYVDLACLEVSPDSDAATFLTKAQAGFPSLIGLTRQLLMYAKGGYPITETCDLAATVAEAAQLALSGCSISLQYTCPTPPLPVRADSGQITQVVNNIVINARQAMKERGSINITINNHASESVEILISDTGPGISDDQLDKIFSPFFTSKETGSGLGLSTSKRIIQNHNGTLEVAKTDSSGTTFRIVLPASKDTAEPITDDHGTLEQTYSGKILIVDDESVIRILATDLLQHVGFSAVAVESCAEACACVDKAAHENDPFRAALVDLTLVGDENGITVAKRLRELDPDLPLVLSSGYNFEDVDFGNDLSLFCATLNKPYSVKQIKKVFRSLQRTPA